MKALVQKLYANPKYIKIFEWGKLVSITGISQVTIQAISLISGILIIRLLPTAEYALYTLANTMLGTMTILTDGGIALGVMSQGGKVWQDREKLGSVVATGLDLRKKFAIASLVIATPVLLYLLRHHGSSWLMSGLIILSLVPAFFTALSGTLLEVPLKLSQDIAPLQKIQVGASVSRLVLLALTIFVFPWAFVAVLAFGLPQVWANYRLRKTAARYADQHQTIDAQVRKEILGFVKKILPGSIYFCLSGQITIWLISIFGSTAALAQVGALGRLSMMLGLFSVLFATLVTPRYSRLPKARNVLLVRYLQIQGGVIGLSIVIIGLVYLFPAEVLWVLGKDYSNLTREITLNIIGSCLTLMCGISFNIAASRGWAINPLISIPISVATIVAGVLLIDISSIRGILTLNIFVGLVETLMYQTFNLFRIRSTPT
ncbi:MAG: polysaccharide biosynthesis protein [Chitinophagaceae bacterium]